MSQKYAKQGGRRGVASMKNWGSAVGRLQGDLTGTAPQFDMVSGKMQANGEDNYEICIACGKPGRVGPDLLFTVAGPAHHGECHKRVGSYISGSTLGLEDLEH